jgi:hypothetical protein
VRRFTYAEELQMIRIFALIMIAVVSLGSAQAATIRVDPATDQLYIVGKIVPGDYDRFVQTLKTSTADINAVNVVSLGGSTVEAFKIGRLIRKFSATNAPSFANYAPEARGMICSAAAKIDRSAPCTCASACFFIWSAGVMRSGNDIHIHRMAYDADFYGSLPPVEAAQKYREAVDQARIYFREMETPDSIFEKMIRMPSFATEPLAEANSMAWPPSFAEWLTARCGSPMNRPNTMCEYEQQRNAAKTALQGFRAER